MKIDSKIGWSDIESLEKEIEDQRGLVAKRCQEYSAAAAALTAETKIEAEMHKELNKDNDPNLGKNPGKSLDNFGKKTTTWSFNSPGIQP